MQINQLSLENGGQKSPVRLVPHSRRIHTPTLKTVDGSQGHCTVTVRLSRGCLLYSSNAKLYTVPNRRPQPSRSSRSIRPPVSVPSPSAVISILVDGASHYAAARYLGIISASRQIGLPVGLPPRGTH